MARWAGAFGAFEDFLLSAAPHLPLSSISALSFHDHSVDDKAPYTTHRVEGKRPRTFSCCFS